MGYALSTASLTYEPFQQVLRGGADQIPVIKQKTDAKVMPLHRQSMVSGAAFKGMLNSSVSSQAFKIANDNKKHYEALCRLIQMNKQPAKMPEAVMAKAEPQAELQAQPDIEADIAPATDDLVQPDIVAEPSVDIQPDMDIEPVITMAPDIAEAAPSQDDVAQLEMDSGVAETLNDLQVIYAYIVEQKFEAAEADEFLQYAVQEQAMQFAQPQATPEQNLQADIMAVAGVQTQAMPQFNFVAAEQMRQAIVAGELPLSVVEQHPHKALFSTNTAEMAQPAAEGQPVVAPVQQIDPQIMQQLQTIAASSQFDADTVKKAAELQIVAPEQNGTVVAKPVQVPLASGNSGNPTDQAMALVKQAKQEQVKDIERNIVLGDLYFREKHIQAGGTNIKFDSKSIKFKAVEEIQREASADQTMDLEKQRQRADKVTRKVRDDYEGGIRHQGDKLRERLFSVNVIDSGTNSLDYTARAKREDKSALTLKSQKEIFEPVQKVLTTSGPGLSIV